MFHYFNENQTLIDMLDKLSPDDIIQTYEPEKINYPINTDLPFFTPTEMIDSGIMNHFNENYMISDEISLKDWFFNYWQNVNGVYSDDTKKCVNAWRNKMTDIQINRSNCSPDEDKKYKEEMYLLGWNPELEFNSDNRIKARDRVTNIVSKRKCDIIDITQDEDDQLFIDESEQQINGNIKPIYIVLVRGETLIGKTIRVVTNSEYSHACISLDNTLEKLYSYNIKLGTSNGFAIENANYFKGSKVCIFAMMVKDEIYQKVKYNIENFEKHAEETKYSILNLFTILFNKTAKFDMELVCSTFVDKILKLSDIDLTEKDYSLVTPLDLYKASKKNNRKKKIYKIFEDIINKYDINKINKKIQKILSKPHLSEGCLITETKAFPVEFDNEGNLLLHRSSRIDFDEEFNKSHRLLKLYAQRNNVAAMKYELSKLYYLNSIIEKKLSRRYNKELVDTRARILNDFNKYIIIVLQKDNKFNFIEYYNNSPFSDSKIKITASTLKWTVETLKSALRLV